ncbi:MAG: ABC transporter ATP-binding protein [Nitrospirales bacterium]|nr:MAG: ABC transporter ATP-binding protein [Nitrospirales bacterium]
MQVILFLLRTSWRKVVLAGLAGVVSGLGGAGLLALINRVLHTSGNLTSLVFWGFCVVSVIILLSRVLSQIVLVSLGQEMIANLRMQLSRKVLGSPIRHMEELGAHRVLATLTDDVAAMATAFVTLPMLCVQLATVVGCLAYLGWLSWQLVVVVIMFIAVGVLSFRLHEAHALKALTSAREAGDRLHHVFRAMTDGMKELKMHRDRRAAFFSQGLQTAVHTYRQAFVSGMTTYTIAGAWSSLLLYTMIGLLLFGVPLMYDLSAEATTGYILVLLYLMSPLELIVEALPGLGRASVALKKVQNLGLSLSSDVQVQDDMPDSLSSLPSVSHGDSIILEQVELVGVTHNYHHEREDRPFLLGPIDVSFYSGEVVFLIGGNGSGKTTLAMLLLGLYVPENGEIRVNGAPILDGQREGYRQYYSTVFSDFHLFDSFFGIETSELEVKAAEYLRLLELDHKVTIHEGKLSTLALSRGQRKRLALVTALLEDRPFYVFDEWAGDQDPVFKRWFYVNALPELKAAGKSVLVITHDDQYFSMADRCLKMHDGQLVPISEQPMIPV